MYMYNYSNAGVDEIPQRERERERGVTNRVREKRSPERSCKGDGEETARDIARNPESSA